MSVGSARRRGLHQRPLLLFGCLLLVPAVGFALLGWNSLGNEQQSARRDLARAARETLDAQVSGVVASLDLLRQREAQRPYYEYQAEVLLTDAQGGENLVVQPSALTRAPEDARVLGWFQWEAGSKGAFAEPERFGPEAEWGLRGLVEGYGAALRSRLEAAASDPTLRAAAPELVPLSQVQANEERGQLIEELDVQRRQQSAAAEPAASPSPGAPPRTPPNARDGEGPTQAPAGSAYLQSFRRRAGADPVPVRATRFQYLARSADATGPSLVAWRLVWIPAAYPERREVTRDRWLLQGYALDVTRNLARDWTPVGQAQVAWLGSLSPHTPVAPDVLRASLAERLGAEIVGGSGGASVPRGRGGEPAPALIVLARPDEEAAEAAWGDARRRFVWLVIALVSVVALGFVVLLRGVRKEVALARRKEDFVAAVTHELKTPLTGIRMYAEMLREGWVADADAAAGYAGRIIDECGRLGHLVDQVLDLAALERGIAGPHLAPGDLGVAVTEAVGLLRSRAAQSHVALTVDVAPGLPPVPFDPRLLRPLVLNLVENAIKYSERAPTKEVHVSLARADDRLVLVVRDRGVGIAPDAQAGLFQPFHRAGDEMTRAAPGVGIGLALVKRYAEVHRAKVTLESAPGQGTVVTVRFPL